MPWGIALTGTATRIAEDLVADLRDGHHLYEIVGGEVERIVASPAPSPYEAAATLRRRVPDVRGPARPPAGVPGDRRAGRLPGRGPRPGPRVSERPGPRAARGAGRRRRHRRHRPPRRGAASGVAQAGARRPPRCGASGSAAAPSPSSPAPRWPDARSCGRPCSRWCRRARPARRTTRPARSPSRRWRPSWRTGSGRTGCGRSHLEDGTATTVTLDAAGAAPRRHPRLGTGPAAAPRGRGRGPAGGDAAEGPTARLAGRARPGEAFDATVALAELGAWAVLVDGGGGRRGPGPASGSPRRRAGRATETALHRRALRRHFAPGVRDAPAGSPRSNLQSLGTAASGGWSRTGEPRALGVFDAHALGPATRRRPPDDAVAPAIRGPRGPPASGVGGDPPESATSRPALRPPGAYPADRAGPRRRRGATSRPMYAGRRRRGARPPRAGRAAPR